MYENINRRKCNSSLLGFTSPLVISIDVVCSLRTLS